ncbi:MAG: crossover junction endodeoxyribonuclease RuvC [Candidatus Omnitrophota bacterium]
MRVLGVDPGTWRTGAGLIESSGGRYRRIHSEVIQAPANVPIEKRLSRIFSFLEEIIRIYRPTVMALENVFYCKNIRSMLKIGEARACAMLAASNHDLPVLEYMPTQVKQAVTGNGRASKIQVQKMIKMLLGMKEMPPSDEADALALAICHLHVAKSHPLMKIQGA